jgi:hypothetical protein
MCVTIFIWEKFCFESSVYTDGPAIGAYSSKKKIPFKLKSLQEPACFRSPAWIEFRAAQNSAAYCIS